jgi:hypothetical protein
MMKRIPILVICLMSCCTLYAAQEQPKDHASVQSLPICVVIADAAKYDGKEIFVRGLYRMVIHGAILMDLPCSKISVNLREAPNYTANKSALTMLRSLTKKNQFQPVAVVFRGIFRVASGGQCFGQICASFEIETKELVSAHPVSRD